jgi:hypothetical protein
MNLRQWSKRTGILPTHPTTGRGAVSLTFTYDTDSQLHHELWRLTDYAVSTVSGPVVWLVPRPKGASMPFRKWEDIATKVLFRKWKDTGTVLALFPEVASDPDPHHCLSYEHVGQHGSADPWKCMRATVPAEPVEYDGLRQELQQRGYVLDVRERVNWKRGFQQRREQLEIVRFN